VVIYEVIYEKIQGLNGAFLRLELKIGINKASLALYIARIAQRGTTECDRSESWKLYCAVVEASKLITIDVTVEVERLHLCD
jgi:hypothetical protein